MKQQGKISIGASQPLSFTANNLLQSVNRQVPGSVNYSIRRYRKPVTEIPENRAELVYHYNGTDTSDNHLQLRFCVSGNFYCKQKNVECDEIGRAHV